MRGNGDALSVSVSMRRRLGRSFALAVLIGSAVAIAGCTASPRGDIKSSRSKEFFAESEYGVKASPRVSHLRTRLPRGGGRDMVGKPYKVKGKWYKPKEEPGYRKAGAASWYGDAFHGRLTANGEIYDMTHLTAAHPTMPLPSYARVTNLKNGSSVIVRVNDRGPFANGRVIDLSKRAAEMLNYKHAGVAKVEVEYLGRAPLHGRDDQFLVASYRPGGGGGRSIDDGLPSGVMIAMNGRTPTSPMRASAFPAAPSAPVGLPPVAIAAATPLPPASGALPAYSPGVGDPALPDVGPIVPERPTRGLGIVRPPMQIATLGALSYADERIASAVQALSSLDASGMSADDVVASWKRQNGASAEPGEYVAAATFASRREAETIAGRLSAFGKVRIETDADSHSVLVTSDGRHGVDRLAELARANGAPDAFVVHE